MTEDIRTAPKHAARQQNPPDVPTSFTAASAGLPPPAAASQQPARQVYPQPSGEPYPQPSGEPYPQPPAGPLPSAGRRATAGPQPSVAGPPRRRYGNGRRVAYGVLWAGWTVLLLIAGFGLMFGGQVLPGLISLVLAGFAGRYDYRIWTWQARRLLFLIIF